MNKTQKIAVFAISIVAAVMFATPIALGTQTHQAFACGGCGGGGGWGWHHHWWHHHWGGWGWHHHWGCC
ncbi:MAG TPA: hypothetical protein VIY08_09610 [Candidatus Nitrosocosmicus sp.]